MNVRSTKTFRRGALAVSLALAIAACSSDDDSSSTATSTAVADDTAAPDTTPPESPGSDSAATTPASASEPAASGAFPVEIEHNLGTAVIESEPERVVVLGDFADLDSVLALGVQPVAFGFTDAWGTGLAPWQIDAGADQIDQFDASAEIDVESVAAADPDLIIGMEYLAEPIYNSLTGVAPVVSLPFDVTWQDQLRTVGQALGRSDRADELVAEVDAALAAGAEELTDVADLAIMVGSYYGDQLYIQGETSSVTGLLRDLGLTVLTTTDEQMDAQSLERVPLLADADIILSFATDTTATTTAEASPLWQNLPAVQANRYTALTGNDARGVSDGFNALSFQTVIDFLVDVVHETAAGNGTSLT